jgi:hypothetical protein
MIGPGTGVRVYVACGVTDMRKGIAGLAALTAYSGTSGHPFRSHPATCSDAFGHL